MGFSFGLPNIVNLTGGAIVTPFGMITAEGNAAETTISVIDTPVEVVTGTTSVAFTTTSVVVPS